MVEQKQSEIITTAYGYTSPKTPKVDPISDLAWPRKGFKVYVVNHSSKILKKSMKNKLYHIVSKHTTQLNIY